MRSQLRYYTYKDAFGTLRRRKQHVLQLNNINQKPRSQYVAHISQIKKRKDQHQSSYSFQVRQKQKQLHKENNNVFKKLALAQCCVPSHRYTKTLPLRSNSVTPNKIVRRDVKPSISNRQLQYEFRQHVMHSNRIKRYSMRQNKPVLKMTNMIRINNPRFMKANSQKVSVRQTNKIQKEQQSFFITNGQTTRILKQKQQKMQQNKQQIQVLVQNHQQLQQKNIPFQEKPKLNVSQQNIISKQEKLTQNVSQ